MTERIREGELVSDGPGQLSRLMQWTFRCHVVTADDLLEGPDPEQCFGLAGRLTKLVEQVRDSFEQIQFLGILDVMLEEASMHDATPRQAQCRQRETSAQMPDAVSFAVTLRRCPIGQDASHGYLVPLSTPPAAAPVPTLDLAPWLAGRHPADRARPQTVLPLLDLPAAGR